LDSFFRQDLIGHRAVEASSAESRGRRASGAAGVAEFDDDVAAVVDVRLARGFRNHGERWPVPVTDDRPCVLTSHEDRSLRWPSRVVEIE
jgi:hypothetical protein